ncbi:hypothetical protein HPB52_023003 [Rhipicephalus sanguineus]|uniref:DUF659 domain-containing protein n=1 Tax=Rhipicephalus sanguineus TaxID=34632 RepID=A0A9D4T4L1_RHISA|nr:hypothetical protein HPB52_023003 [Rhipicephalus sanguineus]
MRSGWLRPTLALASYGRPRVEKLKRPCGGSADTNSVPRFPDFFRPAAVCLRASPRHRPAMMPQYYGMPPWGMFPTPAAAGLLQGQGGQGAPPQQVPQQVQQQMQQQMQQQVQQQMLRGSGARPMTPQGSGEALSQAPPGGGQYQMLAPPYYDQNGSLMMGNTRAVRLMPPVLVNPGAPGTSAPSQPGTTTTLVNHLKRHPDPFKQFEKLRAAECSKKASGPKKTTATKTADASAASCSYFKPTLKGDSQRAKMLTTKVAQFMAAGLHSYSIVEEPGFLSLMHAAVPEYKVPSRTTFSRSVIPDLYAKEKERIKGALRHHFDHGTPCYSVTTDGWSSRPGDSYVSFTCHLLDEESELNGANGALTDSAEGRADDNET